MAYAFASASSRYLSTASAPASGDPMTIAAWVRPTATAAAAICAVGVNGALARNALLINASNAIGASSTNSSNNGAGFFTTGTISTNSWGHAAAVFSSSLSRTAYLDGVAGTVNTANIVVGSTADTVTIGARWANAIGSYFSGDIAEVGIWNVALTAAEIVSLAKSVSPRLVRPQSLVFYAPLIRDLVDVRGGRTITNNNTATVANHPRVYA